MSESQTDAWLTRLVNATDVHKRRLDVGELPEPALAAEAFRLVWSTADAVHANDAAGELWWLRLTETVSETAGALETLPQAVFPGLGLGPTPAVPLLDNPRLRSIAEQLLAAGRGTLIEHAWDQHRIHGIRALQTLTAAIDRPLDFDGYHDALAIAHARAVTYRTARNLTDLYVDARAAAGLSCSQLVLKLQADLAATAEAAGDIPDHPPLMLRAGSAALKLTEAAISTHHAWESLIVDPAAVLWCGDTDPLDWLTDAVVLATYVTRIEPEWEAALTAGASDPAAPSDIARSLRWQLAADSRTVQELQIGAYAPHVVTTADTAAIWTRPPPDQLHTDQVLDTLKQYAGYLFDQQDGLGLPDELAQLGATAARLCTLVAQHTTAGPAADAARDTVRAWRRAYQSAHQLSHAGTDRPGGGLPYRIAEWADRHLQPHPRDADTADWLTQHGSTVLGYISEFNSCAHAALQSLGRRDQIRTNVPARPQPTAAPVEGTPESIDLRYVGTSAGSGLVLRVGDSFFDASRAVLRLSTALERADVLIPQPHPSLHSYIPEDPTVRTARAALDSNRRIRADARWITWHVRTTLRTVHDRPIEPALPFYDPPLADRATHTDLTAALREADPALADAILAHPARPALEAELQLAKDAGRDIHTLVHTALAQPDIVMAPDASLLLGRIRRLPINAATEPLAVASSLADHAAREQQAVLTLATRIGRGLSTAPPTSRERPLFPLDLDRMPPPSPEPPF